MVTNETRYRCDTCKTLYKLEEDAKKCEAQEPPPEILPKGIVFRGKVGNSLAYFVVSHHQWVSPTKHRNQYGFLNWIQQTERNSLIDSGRVCDGIVNRDNQTIGWLNREEVPPARMTPAELEELCSTNLEFGKRYREFMSSS